MSVSGGGKGRRWLVILSECEWGDVRVTEEERRNGCGCTYQYDGSTCDTRYPLVDDELETMNKYLPCFL